MSRNPGGGGGGGGLHGAPGSGLPQTCAGAGVGSACCPVSPTFDGDPSENHRFPVNRSSASCFGACLFGFGAGLTGGSSGMQRPADVWPTAGPCPAGGRGGTTAGVSQGVVPVRPPPPTGPVLPGLFLDNINGYSWPRTAQIGELMTWPVHSAAPSVSLPLPTWVLQGCHLCLGGAAPARQMVVRLMMLCPCLEGSEVQGTSQTWSLQGHHRCLRRGLGKPCHPSPAPPNAGPRPQPPQLTPRLEAGAAVWHASSVSPSVRFAVGPPPREVHGHWLGAAWPRTALLRGHATSVRQGNGVSLGISPMPCATQ